MKNKKLKSNIDNFDANGDCTIQHNAIRNSIQWDPNAEDQVTSIDYLLKATDFDAAYIDSRKQLIKECISFIDDSVEREKAITIVRSYGRKFENRRLLTKEINKMRKNRKVETDERDAAPMSAGTDVRGQGPLIIPDPSQPPVYDDLYDPVLMRGAMTLNRHPDYHIEQPFRAYTYDVLTDCVGQLLFADIKPLDFMYRYQGQQVIFDDSAFRNFEPLNSESIKSAITMIGWYKWTTQKGATGSGSQLILEHMGAPDDNFLRYLCRSRKFRDTFPLLKRFVHGFYVGMQSNGQISIITDKGYSPQTKIFVRNDSILDNTKWDKEAISLEEARAAYDDIVEDAFNSVPFRDEIDIVHAMAAVITCKVRHLFGPSITFPLFAIEAPQHRSGKSTLNDIITTLGTNSEVAGRIPFDDDKGITSKEEKGKVDDYQLRNALIAVLVEGFETITLNNADGSIKSRLLEDILTQGNLFFRILGGNKSIIYGTDDIPSVLFFINGNHLRLAGALARRALFIRIVKQPFVGPKRQNPIGYVTPGSGSGAQRHQNNLAIILNYWIQQGCPQKEVPRSYTGSQPWYALVGGILESILGSEPMELFSITSNEDGLNPGELAWHDYFLALVQIKGAVAVSEVKAGTVSGTMVDLNSKDAIEQIEKIGWYHIDPVVRRLALSDVHDGEIVEGEDITPGMLDDLTYSKKQDNRYQFLKEGIARYKDCIVCEYDGCSVYLRSVKYDANKADWVNKLRELYYFEVAGDTNIEPAPELFTDGDTTEDVPL